MFHSTPVRSSSFVKWLSLKEIVPSILIYAIAFMRGKKKRRKSGIRLINAEHKLYMYLNIAILIDDGLGRCVGNDDDDDKDADQYRATATYRSVWSSFIFHNILLYNRNYRYASRIQIKQQKPYLLFTVSVQVYNRYAILKWICYLFWCTVHYSTQYTYYNYIIRADCVLVQNTVTNALRIYLEIIKLLLWRISVSEL